MGLYKIKEFLLKLFPYDKLAHFVFVGVMPTLFLSTFMGKWLVLLIISTVAILIEKEDKRSDKGEDEVLDVVYAIAGSVLTLILISIITI